MDMCASMKSKERMMKLPVDCEVPLQVSRAKVVEEALQGETMVKIFREVL